MALDLYDTGFRVRDFGMTRVLVHLHLREYISRSEAKRLLSGSTSVKAGTVRIDLALGRSGNLLS